MRAIAAEYFATSDLMSWPLLSLLMFVTVFLAAVVYLVRRGAKPFDTVARLPLEDDHHG
jgi:hypothetical protein